MAGGGQLSPTAAGLLGGAPGMPSAAPGTAAVNPAAAMMGGMGATDPMAAYAAMLASAGGAAAGGAASASAAAAQQQQQQYAMMQQQQQQQQQLMMQQQQYAMMVQMMQQQQQMRPPQAAAGSTAAAPGMQPAAAGMNPALQAQSTAAIQQMMAAMGGMGGGMPAMGGMGATGAMGAAAGAAPGAGAPMAAPGTAGPGGMMAITNAGGATAGAGAAPGAGPGAPVDAHHGKGGAGNESGKGYGPANQKGKKNDRKGPYDDAAIIAHPNVFVGNLPKEMTDAELTKRFEQCGTIVSCRIAMDKDTGKSKGSGFVKFATTEDAQKAVDTMNGQNGLQVKFAFQEPGKSGKGPPPSDNLYVRGLPSPQPEPEQLKKLFGDINLTIVRTKVIPDSKGSGTSAALVQLASVEEATTAINALSGTEHWGNMVFVSYVENKGGDVGSDGSPGRPLFLRVKLADARDVGEEGAEAKTSVYVGGLPSPQVAQERLEELFQKLELTVVRTKLLPDTRQKGFSAALIQLGTQQEAAGAIEVLNGQNCNALGLRSAPLSNGNSWSNNGKGSGKTVAPPVSTTPVTHGNLFIGNVPKHFNEPELKQLFAECGNIVSCKVCRNLETSESKGSGFVKFSSADEAKFAIDNLNGFNNLVVKPADNDTGGKGKGQGKSVPPIINKGAIKGKQAGITVFGFPPAEKVDLVDDDLEMTLNCSFSSEGGVAGPTPSDTLFVVGLPSPQIEEIQFLELFISMGIKCGRIEVIPDETGSQCSAAMISFPSQEVAEQAHKALDGQRPSMLGLKAKPATASHVPGGKGSKGMGGKGQVVAPGPYGAVVAPGPYGVASKGPPPAWLKLGEKGATKSSTESGKGAAANAAAVDDGEWGPEPGTSKGQWTPAAAEVKDDGQWGPAPEANKQWAAPGATSGDDGQWGPEADNSKSQWSAGQTKTGDDGEWGPGAGQYGPGSEEANKPWQGGEWKW